MYWKLRGSQVKCVALVFSRLILWPFYAPIYWQKRYKDIRKCLRLLATSPHAVRATETRLYVYYVPTLLWRSQKKLVKKCRRFHLSHFKSHREARRTDFILKVLPTYLLTCQWQQRNIFFLGCVTPKSNWNVSKKSCRTTAPVCYALELRVSELDRVGVCWQRNRHCV